MGLGTTAKKLQALVDLAERLTDQLKALRNRVVRLESTADETRDRIEALEEDLAGQQALLEAIAAEHDINPAEYTTDGTEPENE